MTKVVLINDTSATPHIGCRLVVSQIREKLASRNLELTHTVPVYHSWESREHKEKVREADLVIVNGEGTIHHTKPRARVLSRVAPFCAKHGIPAYLINAVFQANNEEIQKNVKQFRRIFVRECFSQAELRKAKIPADIVPDLSLSATGVTFPNGATPAPLVTDSTKTRVARQLRQFANASGSNYVRLQSPKRGGPLDEKKILKAFGNASVVVTGRFHGACLALLARKPLFALRSNTWKIEGMFADIGLRGRILKEPLKYYLQNYKLTTKESVAVKAYLESAKFYSDKLFDFIAEDFR